MTLEPTSLRAPTQGRDGVEHRPEPQRALVVHPLRAGRAAAERAQRRLDEAVGLALALDLVVVGREIAPIREVRPSTLFGRGKVEALTLWREACAADVLIVDDALTPVQQRNLERALKAKVVDRTGLILEIFARRARTREGRLQVELARLAYERSRLVRTWTHLERQRGGFGVMGGPGETQIETDRRLLAEKIGRLKRELEEVRRTRGLHRAARQRTPYPIIALVGYTNAGKSTLFNRLTASRVEARDLLFATLDTTLRSLDLPDGRPALMSDTVGFISDLPHELVAAFRATLEEVETADVVVHVRDVSSEGFETEGRDVETVLGALGFEAPEARERLVEVWNKTDRLTPEALEAVDARAGRAVAAGRPPAFPLSAATGVGCSALIDHLALRVDQAAPAEIRLAAGDGEALAWLYRHGRVTRRLEDEGGDVRLEVRLDPAELGRFQNLFPLIADPPRAAR